MNDRELLEKAARALLPEDWYNNADYMKGFMGAWNPLDDDGDAFRLAVKLEINVQHDATDIWATTLRETSVEGRGQDVFAATRRAITRAAAEIGENL